MCSTCPTTSTEGITITRITDTPTIRLIQHIFRIDASQDINQCKKCQHLVSQIKKQSKMVTSVRRHQLPNSDTYCAICGRTIAALCRNLVPAGFLKIIKHVHDLDVTTTQKMCSQCYNLILAVLAAQDLSDTEVPGPSTKRSRLEVFTPPTDQIPLTQGVASTGSSRCVKPKSLYVKSLLNRVKKAPK